MIIEELGVANIAGEHIERLVPADVADLEHRSSVLRRLGLKSGAQRMPGIVAPVVTGRGSTALHQPCHEAV